ncbi:DNA-binding protein [Sinorhizobium meliloti]|nr:DNA-binding protein [Sinorhizobium meliloti]MDW9656723.1 DNA-binding protein [Sinorhizobium meliloti]MDW9682208.1 DNA-binding protein [Sinorhizobium meliloti]MDW9694813.1 DNA-binding protein [Sinorhizobium meliloti]MDW9719574.1 DNA-binding protein [Sinorhizobium meliloti]
MSMTVSVAIDVGPRDDSGGLLVADAFSDDRAAGTVIGTHTTNGVIRGGCDSERQIAIDHGTLRFQPLVKPGWARQGIAYGPFRRASGLVMAVSVTNGHNTSQGTTIGEHILRRIHRWALGANADPWPNRLVSWACGPRKKGTFRRFLWWARSTRTTYKLPDFNENLALGWFTSDAPRDPLSDGCGFIVHAAKGENGELWTRVGTRCLSAFRGLKNLQIYYFVALRERGAIYYAAAMEGAHGLAAFPMMRPIAIDPFNDDETLYAGVHQCVLGQIGFRVDTRIHGIRVHKVPDLTSRFGTAHVGDPMTRDAVASDIAGRSGSWRVLRGNVDRTDTGAVGGDGVALATSDPGVPSGLIHAIAATGDTPGACGLAWRVRDGDNFWLFKVSGEGSALIRVEQGAEVILVSDARRSLAPDTLHSLQILDGYGQIGCYLDGDRLFGIDDQPLEEATATGIWFDGAGGVEMRDFETHPREVPIPPFVLFEAPWLRLGHHAEIVDDFAGPFGDLAGRAPRIGGGTWGKTFGVGLIDVTGNGAARVRGTVEKPHPNRTLYTLPWDQVGFADLEVTITPPGEERGQAHCCRTGLVFWQDRDNYLTFTVYLDDDYHGSSIALFTKRHGFEELYDAVWTMLWTKIDWGKPFRLRIPFDGERFVVFVDDEPVMQRALTDLYPDDPPLQILRVGLAVNWEWGNDTGSSLQSFIARR